MNQFQASFKDSIHGQPEIKFIEVLIYLLRTLQLQEAEFINQTISQFMAYLLRSI
ncbi:hypothetical protein [Limosilactobacillus caccae]|uniref:hypothetical protein n=1 Tax=Limosilactobacillus caccae TaxID=1926284 RepID=UPI001356423E|nr:hypothetical protein [Limosilactobacillus caccae]